MTSPWDVRPRVEKGDDSADAIYLQVGRALTLWEMLESTCAELFDVVVAAQPSNRAAFAAYTAVKSASARSELLSAAVSRAIPLDDSLHELVMSAINSFKGFGARRNEIAHGRLYNLGEHGFFLGPINVMPHKWSKEGMAKYQYTSVDIGYYCEEFENLNRQIIHLIVDIVAIGKAANNAS